MTKHAMRVTVALHLAALLLAVAGHVTVPPPARGGAFNYDNEDALPANSTMFAEPQSSVKLPPTASNRIKSGALDDGKVAKAIADHTAIDRALGSRRRHQRRREHQVDGSDLLIRACNHGRCLMDSFDLAPSSKSTYLSFLADLDFHVNATGERWIRHHPVLEQQRLHSRPATILVINVTGNHDDRVMFLLRSDNLYVFGFINKYGTMFTFQPQGNRYVIMGSILLSFGGGYADLFGTIAHRGLLHVKIGKLEALHHLSKLANYRGGRDVKLKTPLAFFILVISEAERFAPIRQAVHERWDSVSEKSIDDVVSPNRHRTHLLDLVVNWRTFSCALLCWNKHGETPRAWTTLNGKAREIGVFGVASAEQALSKVNPILHIKLKRCHCHWT